LPDKNMKKTSFDNKLQESDRKRERADNKNPGQSRLPNTLCIKIQNLKKAQIAERTQAEN
jgi:hypothetical protein